MKIYIIKSLKWTDTPNYLFQTVYWGENNNGYTTNINKAGLYTEEQIQSRPNYYNNGVSTVAILVERKSASRDEYEIMLSDIATNKIHLEEKQTRYQELKLAMREMEIDMKELESLISKQEQELRIQTLITK